jgi:hypothetical protein
LNGHCAKRSIEAPWRDRTSRSEAPPPTSGAPAAGGDPIAEWQKVYEDFIRTKKECGEPTDGLTFEKLLAAALFAVTDPATRARRMAIFTFAVVVLAVIPDQTAQFLLTTRGFELAKEGAAYRDTTDFIAFENMMFPLTSGWAAVLYTLGAIGWALVLREVGIWNRMLGRLSPPMLVLFMAISVAPILPVAIRPKAELIGAGNALAFTVLEVWFVLIWRLLRKRLAGVARE